jgi:hypothetical protein
VAGTGLATPACDHLFFAFAIPRATEDALTDVLAGNKRLAQAALVAGRR